MAEVYSVGISVYLQDRATAAMSTVSRAMMQAGAHTAELQKKMKGVHDTIMKLQALQGLGQNMFHGGVEIMEQMIHHAKDYNSELAKMQLAGMSVVQMEMAKNAAINNSHRDLTTSYTDNLKHIQDLRSAMGGPTKHGLEEVIRMLPAFTDTIRIMRASMDTKLASRAEEQTIYGAKALEMSGSMAKGEEYASDQLDQMRRVATLTHGRVDFKEYLNFFKQSKSAGMMYDNDYKYRVSQYMMQEMGGLRWGTENQAMNQTMNQGVMTVQAAQNAQNLGLIDYSGEISKKNVRKVGANFMAGHELWKSNPFEAVMEFQNRILKARPDIAAIQDPQSRYKAEAAEINKIGWKTNTTDAIVKMLMTQDMIKYKERPMYDMTQKRDAALKTTKETAIDKEAQVHKQYENAMINLGKAAMPLAIKGMTLLANGLAAVNRFMEAHPVATKILAMTVAAVTAVGGLLAFGAGLAIIGTVLGVTAGTLGAWAAGIAAAIAAVTALFLHLSGDLPRVVQRITKGVVDLWQNAATMTGKWLNIILQKFSEFFQSIGKAISGMVTGPANWLAGAVHGYMDPVVNKFANASNTMHPLEVAKKMPAANTPTISNQMRTINNHSSNSHGGVKVDTVNMNINQQPGETLDGKKLFTSFLYEMHGAMIGTTQGGGTLESAFHQGGAIG